MDQRRALHCVTSLDTQKFASLVAYALFLATLSVRTSWIPLNRCQHVPIQQSTGVSRSMIDSMMHRTMITPQRHLVQGDMLIAWGSQLCWGSSTACDETSQCTLQHFSPPLECIGRNWPLMPPFHCPVSTFLFLLPSTSWVDQLMLPLVQSTFQFHFEGWTQHCR